MAFEKNPTQPLATPPGETRCDRESPTHSVSSFQVQDTLWNSLSIKELYAIFMEITLLTLTR